MQCRCPICSALTQVPAELINFFARCESCGGLLRPELTTRSDGRDVLRAEPVVVGRVREFTAQNSGIAELLYPPLVKKVVRNAAAPPTQVMEALAEAAAKEQRVGRVVVPPVVAEGFARATAPVMPPIYSAADSVTVVAAENGAVAFPVASRLAPLPRSRRNEKAVGLTIVGVVTLVVGLLAVILLVAIKVAGAGLPKAIQAQPAGPSVVPMLAPPPKAAEKPHKRAVEAVATSAPRSAAPVRVPPTATPVSPVVPQVQFDVPAVPKSPPAPEHAPGELFSHVLPS